MLGRRRCWSLKSDHSLVATFPLGTGNADGQIGTTAEGICVTSDGRICVADTPNHRINVYDSAGVFLASFGSFGSGSGQFKSPKQVAASGNVVWVADSGNNRLVTVQEDPGGITPVMTTRSNSTTIPSNGNATVDATCNAGEVVIGGGCTTTGNVNVVIQETWPATSTSWRCFARSSQAASNTLTAYARCMVSPIV